MDGTFWVGLAGIVGIAVVSVVVLLIVRARGKRLPAEPWRDQARAEAEQLREQGRRDGYIG
ncbi:hypothetical protein ACFVAJ_08875 [Agromyces sp. NPDC057679]|uniref:hypothetical protein n=1 Tax=Agromyces sp. NPDC057679 TaxID=3346207 RepID=UPI00366B4E30